MSSEQCSLVFTHLSFCSCHLLGILNVWAMLQWDSTSIVILLCVTKYAASGKSQEDYLFRLFSPDFSHISYVFYCLTYYTIFIFITFLFSYLWLFQFFRFYLFAFPICSFFQMELNDFLFFLRNVFTLAYRIWITASPSLFQVAAVWQCYKKPQWQQCQWQT